MEGAGWGLQDSMILTRRSNVDVAFATPCRMRCMLSNQRDAGLIPSSEYLWLDYVPTVAYQPTICPDGGLVLGAREGVAGPVDAKCRVNKVEREGVQPGSAAVVEAVEDLDLGQGRAATGARVRDLQEGRPIASIQIARAHGVKFAIEAVASCGAVGIYTAQRGADWLDQCAAGVKQLHLPQVQVRRSLGPCLPYYHSAEACTQSEMGRARWPGIARHRDRSSGPHLASAHQDRRCG